MKTGRHPPQVKFYRHALTRGDADIPACLLAQYFVIPRHGGRRHAHGLLRIREVRHVHAKDSLLAGREDQAVVRRLRLQEESQQGVYVRTDAEAVVVGRGMVRVEARSALSLSDPLRADQFSVHVNA